MCGPREIDPRVATPELAPATSVYLKYLYGIYMPHTSYANVSAAIALDILWLLDRHAYVLTVVRPPPARLNYESVH
jgi:hypothetical protein